MRKKKTEKSVFSRTLSTLMKKKKITVRELSELTEKNGRRISPSTLSEWSHGVASSDYEALSILAKSLGVTLEFLLLGVESNETEIPVNELFDEGEQLFEGVALVSIKQLIKKKIKK